jgi:Methyltransferase domain
MTTKFPLVLRRRFEKVRARYRTLAYDYEQVVAQRDDLRGAREELRALTHDYEQVVAQRDDLLGAREELRALTHDYEKVSAQRDDLLSVRADLRALSARIADTTGILESLIRSTEATASLSELAEVLAGTRLQPIAVCHDRASWDRFCSGVTFRRMQSEDEAILVRRRFDEEWELPGYCFPAQRFVNFKVDNLYGSRVANQFFPNIRERLLCPETILNNRQRLMATLIAAELAARKGPCDIYLMEQVTPIFKWICSRYSEHTIVGSEYLGHNLAPGQVVDGIRHEDILGLSFADASIDLIISTDVMEHVPSPAAGFREVARVLRPGGRALMTFPFHSGRSQSVTRAEILDGALAHRLEPVYHGNPISAEGSLVFTDFGWDLLDVIRAQGFEDVALEVYHSMPMGNLGIGIVFNLVR